MVVDFAKRIEMVVLNTFFQKRQDRKVVVGESVARQHRVVVCRMTLVVRRMSRTKTEQKTKWWKMCGFQRRVETGSGWSEGASR